MQNIHNHSFRSLVPWWQC